jgi:hypothetical protein
MKFFLCFFSILLLIAPVFSQNLPDSIADTQVKNAIAIYDHYNANNAPIYNGPEYLYYTFKMQGGPYLETREFSKGWVSYRGRKYDSVSLLYDVIRNDLVVLAPNKISSIIMLNQFIDSFSLYGHKFISLREDHKQNLYNTGFYDVLYEGKNVDFLQRHIKSMMPTIQGNRLVTVFQSRNRFYIHKNGLYYLVSNKKDVFRVFSDTQRELKKMMRRNHLKLKHKNFESAMVKVAAFYDQLTH